MKIKIYHTFDEVQAIWQDFEEQAEMYVFQNYNWLVNWYNCIGRYENVRPCIIIINNENDETMLILPMGIKKRYVTRYLTWLGRNMADYHGPLISKACNHLYDVNEIINSIKILLYKDIDAICLEKQPEFIGNLRNPFILLREASPSNLNSYSAKLDGDWDSFCDNMIKPKILADTKRQLNRLKKLGNLTFKIATADEDKVCFTKSMIEQKSRRYNETKANNLFDKECFKQFYSIISNNDLSDRFKVHISALFLNDKIIASHWGAFDKERFYYLMPTFEGGEMAKYSAGRLLLLELFNWSFANNIKIFDFTVGGELYKKNWCNTEMKLYEYINALNIRGALLKFIDNTIKHIKQHQYLYIIAKRIRRLFRKKND